MHIYTYITNITREKEGISLRVWGTRGVQGEYLVGAGGRERRVYDEILFQLKTQKINNFGK